MLSHKFHEIIDSRLQDIRSELRHRGLDMLIIPRFDQHMAEYVAIRDERLAWATGFTGSAGVCVVTRNEAVIFVDGRYTVQVRQQCPAELFSFRHLNDEPIEDWVAMQTLPDQLIGYDPMLIPSSWHSRLNKACTQAKNQLVEIEENIIEHLWDDRPPIGSDRVRPFGPTKSGQTVEQKRLTIIAEIKKSGADFLVEAQPDNIAWLLNIRGSDIPFNAFVNSFLILDSDGQLSWFVEPSKVPQNIEEFEMSDVDVRSPTTLISMLASLSKTGQTALVDPDFAPVAIKLECESAGGNVTLARSPITLVKAIKNEVELKGFRDCHLLDSVAWLKFGAWLQKEVPIRAATNNPVRELEAQAKILELRQMNPDFVYDSFNPISAAGRNASMCHYKSLPGSNAPILSQESYLLDSGGQYECGTTDASRTYVFSEMEALFCETYTAVLKGFIALATLQFPVGTRGHHIDAVARAPLWRLGLDYDHGTGHGVGHFLSVHEQPQRIGKPINEVDLKTGMVISIEPGYYKTGEFGIRIENLFEIVEACKGFMKFKTLSIMPIGMWPVLIDKLDLVEKNWLNEYHSLCRRSLTPLVSELDLEYLKKVTAAI